MPPPCEPFFSSTDLNSARSPRRLSHHSSRRRRFSSRSVAVENDSHRAIENRENEPIKKEKAFQTTSLIVTIIQCVLLFIALCVTFVIYFNQAIKAADHITYVLATVIEMILLLLAIAVLFSSAMLFRVLLIAGHLCVFSYGSLLIAKHGQEKLDPVACFTNGKECFFWPIGAKNHFVYLGFTIAFSHLLMAFIASMISIFFDGSESQMANTKRSLAIMETKLTVAALNACAEKKERKSRSCRSRSILPKGSVMTRVRVQKAGQLDLVDCMKQPLGSKKVVSITETTTIETSDKMVKKSKKTSRALLLKNKKKTAANTAKYNYVTETKSPEDPIKFLQRCDLK